jgi:hypothetical protein
MFFSEQEDFYSRLGDQLGATGVLEASLSDGGLRALQLFDAGSPFGKASWEIEFIGERNEIRGKPHG